MSFKLGLRIILGLYPKWAKRGTCSVCKMSFPSAKNHFEHAMEVHGGPK